MSELFNPLNDSAINFGGSVIALQQRFKAYEAEQVKRKTSLQELQTLLVPKIEILQRLQGD